MEKELFEILAKYEEECVINGCAKSVIKQKYHSSIVADILKLINKSK